MINQQFYAARCKDANLLSQSSSGGVFGILASSILANGGIVYGASFSSDFSVMHNRCGDIKYLPKLFGSKYVQSSIESVYETIGSDLARGFVLFSGTPCQVAAIRNYIKAKHFREDNLILCDILCHGVPSPLIWHDYINLISRKIGKLSSISFRNKRLGWDHYSIKFEAQEKCYENENLKDPYMRLFLSNFILRESCFQCPFATKERVGDITLGDYWGIQRVHPDFYDERGVSLCIINTPKGRQLFQKNISYLNVLETTFEKCVQPVFNNKISKSPKKYMRFWNQYFNSGLPKALKVLPSLSIQKAKNRFKRLLIFILKKTGMFNFVKRMVGRKA
jgi:coenzyme F420-reducing hydrogenase beta subunit